MTSILESVKLSLRKTSDDFDSEIEEIIAACKIDLKIAGVAKIEDDDPLILRAVTLYAKAHFGFANAGESFQKSYEALKVSLCLAGDYNVR
ncbi:MAG: DNA-packaging protein [Defluviitaleaceae bacterium]|nr:DNA-packaging protein [Defluviitaleaceae bacterium]